MRNHSNEKHDLSNCYAKELIMQNPKFINLQVGDNDLIGNKFNGHDLHINLRKRNIESNHLVWNKESDDKNTYVIAGEKPDRVAIRKYNEYIQHLYDLDNIHNPLIYDIIYNKLFLDADVVHLHLMHNGLWDLNLLPIMSKLKPIVWTVHDMWIATGDAHAKERPDYFFPFLSGAKNLDFNWELKKEAIENSNITFVVASKYMEEAMNEYPLFKEKKIVYIPFGLNFDIFYPRDVKKTREELGLGLSEKIIIVRGDVRAKKGLDYIEYVMDKLSSKYKLHFLIVGPSELVVPPNVKTTYYGWVKDDELMAKLYSAADLLLMPSTREYFGMMAIESMACGTLPIVLDGTALPNTVNAPICGVSTHQDKDEYCDTVEHYLTNDQERVDRAKKCVEYVHNKHSMDKYLDSLEDVYKNAIKSHKEYEDSKNLLAQLKLHNAISPSPQVIDPNYICPAYSKLLARQKQDNQAIVELLARQKQDNQAIVELLARQKQDNQAIVELRDRDKNSNQLIAELKIQNAYYTNSSSWKVTKPLRKVAKLINKAKRGDIK